MYKTPNYQIDVEGDSISITNLQDNTVEFIVLNQAFNWATLVWMLEGEYSRHYWELSTDRTRSDKAHAWDKIYITDSRSYFDIWQREGNNLTCIKPDLTLNTCKPFTLVTGCSGGGTSIVVKSLRYLGVYFGADCGDFINRKTHESVALRVYLDQFISKGGRDVNNNFLSSALKVYKRKEDRVNAFKLTDLGYDNRLEKITSTLNIERIISVVKGKVKQYNENSYEGARFNNLDQLEIFQQQFLPIEGKPVFHLDWNKYFSDYTYVNKVLNFLNVDIVLDQDMFNRMLLAVEFDKSKF